MFRLDTIGKKIGAGYIAVALMLTAAVGTTAWQVQKTAEISDRLIETSAPTSQLSLQMLAGINRSLASLRGWMIIGEQSFRTQLNEAWSQQIEPALIELEELSPRWHLQEDRDRLAALKSRLKRFKGLQRQIEEIANTENNTPHFSKFIKTVRPYQLDIISDIEKALALAKERIVVNGKNNEINVDMLTSLHQLERYYSESKLLFADINSYLIAGEQSDYDELLSAKNSEQKLFDTLGRGRSIFTVNASENLFQSIQINRGKLLLALEEVIEARQKPDWDLSTFWLSSRAAPAAEEIVKLLRALSLNGQTAMTNDFKSVVKQNSLLVSIEWILLISGIIASALLGFFVTRSVTQPFKQIQNLADAVAKGDYSTKINIKGSKEIATLVETLQRMVESLQSTTETAQSVAEGNLNLDVHIKSDQDRLGIALNTMIEGLRSSQREAARQFALVQNSEVRANSIIDNMEDGLISITADGYITVFNPAAERIFQYTRDELIGKNINLIMPEEHAKQHDDYLNRYKRTGERRFRQRQVKGRRKDNSLFPAAVTVTEINIDGEKQFIGTIRDISERIQAEEAEMASRQALQAEKDKLLEQDWLKTHYARVLEKIQGVRDIYTFGKALLNEVVPILEAQLGLFYTKEHHSNNHNTEKRTELTLTASYAYNQRQSLSNRYGFGEGLVGQSALEKTPILITDPPGDYLKIDTGFSQVVPAQIQVIPLIFENEVLGVLEIATLKPFTSLQQSLLDQITANLGIFINIIVGRSRTEHLLARSQTQAEELGMRERQLQQANLDLERKTRVAEQANKSKSEFLANMSHELRTPLNSLLILSESLCANRDGNLSNQNLEAAQIIHQSGSDLLALINDILDLAKVEAGKIDVKANSFQLNELIKKLQNKFTHMAKEKGIHFQVELGENLPAQITSDQMRVEQILRNFLSNSIKFTHKGCVTLKATLGVQSSLNSPPAILFHVQDTGIGIPNDKIDHIFNAFEQIDGSSSREYGGTGLGLSIAREMAHILGGEVSVQSEIGVGSTFTFSLPFKQPPTPPRRTTKIEQSKPSLITDSQIHKENKLDSMLLKVKENNIKAIRDDRHNLHIQDDTILIIEDDPAFAKILRDTSHKKGMKCLIAHCGQVGLELALQHPPTAIILDIGLPDISGLEVFSRLLNDQRTADIPVYFISVYDDNQEALSKGAIGYLTKPITEDQLNNALDKIREAAGTKLKSILVVEDDHSLLEYLKILLEEFELEVLGVDSAEKALPLLKTQSFSGLILDMVLPGMSGMELLDQISTDPDLTPPPVIIYSGSEISKQDQARLENYHATLIKKNGGAPEKVIDDVLSKLTQPQTLESQDQENIEEKSAISTKDPALNDDIFKNKRVLLVDDDTRNIYAIGLLLKQMDMTVIMADNGQKALEVLNKQEHIDIVLMDIMMPIMDGYEATQRIRQQTRFADLPIIAVTAKAMKEDREKCLAIGASDYLAKPIEARKLFAIMAQWLQRSSSTKQVDTKFL